MCVCVCVCLRIGVRFYDSYTNNKFHFYVFLILVQGLKQQQQEEQDEKRAERKREGEEGNTVRRRARRQNYKRNQSNTKKKKRTTQKQSLQLAPKNGKVSKRERECDRERERAGGESARLSGADTHKYIHIHIYSVAWSIRKLRIRRV